MPKCITDRYILNFSIPLSSTERENTVTDVVAGMREWAPFLCEQFVYEIVH